METEDARPPVVYISDAENTEIADRVFARNEAVLERLAVAEDALPSGWKSLGDRLDGWYREVGEYSLLVAPTFSGKYEATAWVRNGVRGIDMLLQIAMCDTRAAAFALAVDLARAMSKAVLPPFEEEETPDRYSAQPAGLGWYLYLAPGQDTPLLLEVSHGMYYFDSGGLYVRNKFLTGQAQSIFRSTLTLPGRWAKALPEEISRKEPHAHPRQA